MFSIDNDEICTYQKVKWMIKRKGVRGKYVARVYMLLFSVGDEGTEVGQEAVCCSQTYVNKMRLCDYRENEEIVRSVEYNKGRIGEYINCARGRRDTRKVG